LGIARQIGFDAELFGAPIAQPLEDRDQSVAGGAEREGDLRRRGANRLSAYDAISFQFAELGSENFLTDASQEIAEFSKTQWAKKRGAKLLELSICR
jgi:hypothetical protein